MNPTAGASILVAVLALLGPGAVQAGVSVDINIAPPPLIVSAPPVVVVPGTPVHHVPSVGFNLFVYGGHYYSFHNGGWFVTTRLGAPWAPIVIERVPQPVLGVPVRYYKVPPGHMKKFDRDHGGPPGHGKGGKKHRD